MIQWPWNEFERICHPTKKASVKIEISNTHLFVLYHFELSWKLFICFLSSPVFSDQLQHWSLLRYRMSHSPEMKDDSMECPLCMEPLEIDDVNFFPCTCGYQICRFCWHRIRTDENGLCPACRKVRKSKEKRNNWYEFDQRTDNILQRWINTFIVQNMQVISHLCGCDASRSYENVP